MLGDFTYYNPTKLIFGKDAMTALAAELEKYGKTVQLVYGGGSIKKNGIYDQVIAALEAAGKTVVEDAGVMPNPTAQKLREGARIARENDVDFILAVGGGSCIDYSKAVAVSKNLPGALAGYGRRARGLRPHHGGHRIRDELRIGHYQPRVRHEDRPRLLG